MKLQNSTTWTDSFLRRLVSWTCRELGLPARFVKTARFRNSRSVFGGRAYHWRTGGEITVCIGAEKHFPYTDRRPILTRSGPGIRRHMADRIEALVNVTAHELRHLQAEPERERTRGSGREIGSSEYATEFSAQRVLAAFRARREELLADWSQERPAKPAPSIIERRATKAAADLARWQRKAKLAATKIKKLKARVRYYERKAAGNVATAATPETMQGET